MDCLECDGVPGQLIKAEPHALVVMALFFEIVGQLKFLVLV